MKTITNLPTCPQTLTENDLRKLKEDGYLAFRDVLDPADLEAARDALRELTRQLAF